MDCCNSVNKEAQFLQQSIMLLIWHYNIEGSPSIHNFGFINGLSDLIDIDEWPQVSLRLSTCHFSFLFVNTPDVMSFKEWTSYRFYLHKTSKALRGEMGEQFSLAAFNSSAAARWHALSPEEKCCWETDALLENQKLRIEAYEEAQLGQQQGQNQA